MSLEKKSLPELRAIAQSMGLGMRTDLDRGALLQQIRLHTMDAAPLPAQPVVLNIQNVPDDRILTPELVEKSLAPFSDLGLRISFPDATTWEMRCGEKKDSGTLSMSLWSVIQCAKSLVGR